MFCSRQTVQPLKNLEVKAMDFVVFCMMDKCQFRLATLFYNESCWKYRDILRGWGLGQVQMSYPVLQCVMLKVQIDAWGWGLVFSINSLPASGDVCHLLKTFANSLDPDQAWINVGPIWIQNVWHSDGIPEKFFWKKKIIHRRQKKKHAKLPSMQRGKTLSHRYMKVMTSVLTSGQLWNSGIAVTRLTEIPEYPWKIQECLWRHQYWL